MKFLENLDDKIFVFLCRRFGLLDKRFHRFIEKEAKRDLDTLINIQLQKGMVFRLYKDTRFFGDGTGNLVEILREKYKYGCPSTLFKYASKRRKEEYLSVHKNILYCLCEEARKVIK